MYVCGPTVYSKPHLGHIRMSITFDILYRYLLFLGYKVRYVRNITDVGHLENEITEGGEDKILKKAKLEQLEPMEIAQKYKLEFQHVLEKLNILPPSIEPLASGHIIEQQTMIQKIIDNGFAYEQNGSIYFDLEKYSQIYKYGKLSGKKIEDLIFTTQDLNNQTEKKNLIDFALWKKADVNHIMQWPSKWGAGFPGWHIECSAMSTKYLGETFDIHGGGLDLQFPHHECEIAQAIAANDKIPVKYWIHNNMITINKQKMARSLNNFITLENISYTPMVLRFFILQTHYRSTIDFSDKALQAAEKGLKRLMEGFQVLLSLKPSTNSSFDIISLEQKCYNAMNDDLNYPLLLAHLFDGIKLINRTKNNKETLLQSDINTLITLYRVFLFNILGLEEEINHKTSNQIQSDLIDLLLNLRINAKNNNDFILSDKIRDSLNSFGIEVQDNKHSTEWKFK